ncbi:MAG: tellurite resistance/C4-dicarboxylate transporter family protein [Myxococcales bacterium]|nr:tellurite resistance/C4-dicarboxylate transporter family protein [Myxococcales bacterium]
MTEAAQPSGGLAGMHPAYFALVMATGIVSLACEVVGLHPVAVALFALNLGFYPLLWGLLIARVIRHRDRVRADLVHHARAVGFFTIVAATCVLGSQCLIVGDSLTAALGLWFAGIVLWAVLIYGVFAILTVKTEKPALADGINGGWLISVVAAQSVSVLGAQLAPTLGAHTEAALVFSLAMWLGGGMLYLWIISLIFYRYTFFTMSPSDLAPPYWINMGAAAISTLAGTMLVAAAPHSPALEQILPFVRGFTWMWWATATWWIPMLLILGIWRHGIRKFPLRYDPLYWGAVFPLGMYTVCTFRLSRVVDAEFLGEISRVFVYAALGAWCVVAAGMVWHLLRGPRRAAVR